MKALRCAVLAIGFLSLGGLAEAQEAPALTATAASGGKINLDLDGAAPEEAFDALAKQAGVELHVGSDQLWNNADPIIIKVQNGYFWPTFLEMCKQARIRYDVENRGRGESMLRLYNASNGSQLQYANAPRCVSQGFVITATNASRSFQVSYDSAQRGNRRNDGYFNISMQVLNDPAAGISQMYSPRVTEAVDENGLSLLPPQSNESSYYGGNESSLIQNVSLNLASPKNIGQKLVRLKGTIRGMAVVKSEDIRFDLPLQGSTTRPFQDQQIVIKSLTPDPASGKNRYKLALVIGKAEAGGDNSTPRRRTGGLRQRSYSDHWSLINQISIKDAAGKSYNVGGGGSNGDSSGNQVYDVIVYGSDANIGAPAKFAWKVPAETRSISVPFEFTDLAIP